METGDPWRLFRRMQDSLAAAAALIYAACVLDAWRVLPVPALLKLERTLLFPALYFGLSLAGCLAVSPLSRALRRHLMTSYRAGFGQSVISVLGGVAAPLALAGVIAWQIHGAHGGRSLGGAFSGYAAGLGLLLAEAILVRRLERAGAPRSGPGVP